MIDKTHGITEPPIDDLLKRVDNKYQLVIFASRRARQINDYYADLHEGSLYGNIGPLVDSSIDDKPLSIALREINEGKVVMVDASELPQASEDAGIEFDDFSLDDILPEADVEGESSGE